MMRRLPRLALHESGSRGKEIIDKQRACSISQMVCIAPEAFAPGLSI